MKSDTVYKRTFNTMLRHISAAGASARIESETRLAARFAVSRTTVRKALTELERQSIISRSGAGALLLRKPAKRDYFPLADTVAASAQVEKQFMEWMLRGDRKPGEQINGLELAREFNVSTNAVRDYLTRFTRFGLVEKRANSGWILLGFTPAFALELFEVREMFEIRSARAFGQLPAASEVWVELRSFEQEHRQLHKSLATRYQDFSELDERFHRFVNAASHNRFVADFNDVISLIFHYHYQWSKLDERERNARAIEEHVAYIEALLTRDPKRIEQACRKHLESARRSLLASIK